MLFSLQVEIISQEVKHSELNIIQYGACWTVVDTRSLSISKAQPGVFKDLKILIQVKNKASHVIQVSGPFLCLSLSVKSSHNFCLV